jgi:hypothetical protein
MPFSPRSCSVLPPFYLRSSYDWDTINDTVINRTRFVAVSDSSDGSDGRWGDADLSFDFGSGIIA